VGGGGASAWNSKAYTAVVQVCIIYRVKHTLIETRHTVANQITYYYYYYYYRNNVSNSLTFYTLHCIIRVKNIIARNYVLICSGS
jgi:hypothetical protein